MPLRSAMRRGGPPCPVSRAGRGVPGYRPETNTPIARFGLAGAAGDRSPTSMRFPPFSSGHMFAPRRGRRSRLLQERGDPYDEYDIGAQGVRAVLPRVIGGRPFIRRASRTIIPPDEDPEGRSHRDGLLLGDAGLGGPVRLEVARVRPVTCATPHGTGPRRIRASFPSKR